VSTRSRAIAELPPPAGFSVLVEQLAGEMAASGIIPGSPMFLSDLFAHPVRVNVPPRDGSPYVLPHRDWQGERV